MNLKPRLITGIALAFALTVTGGTAFGKHHAAVFKVLPTGTNDTANLQAAFDAAVQAGPGSTVQLVKGTYYIDKGIAVANFDGNFVGAGKDKTFVQNLGQFSPYELWLTFYLEGQNVSGPITLSDLTFRAVGPAETDPEFYQGPLNAFMILTFTGEMTGDPDAPLDTLNASVIRVGIEGQSGDQYTPWGCNISDAIGFSAQGWTAVAGNCLFQDCTFKNSMDGMCPLGLQDARFKVEGCTFDDVQAPIGTWNLLGNTKVDILCNRIHMHLPWCAGVYMESETPGGNSTVRISHNEISVSSFTDAIRIDDWGSPAQAGEPTIKHTVISDNDIHLEGTLNGAIAGLFASNVMVADNTISGHGRLGIYTGYPNSFWRVDHPFSSGLDDFSPPASNWVIVGNNLKHADTVYSPILLGPNTSHCLVKADADDVLNMGTDNTIIDVHPKH